MLKNEVVINLLDLLAFVFITQEVSRRLNYLIRLTIFFSTFLFALGLFLALSNYVGDYFTQHFGVGYWQGLAIKLVLYALLCALFGLVLKKIVNLVNISEQQARDIMVLLGLMLFLCSRALAIAYATQE